jgi:hypothetical protein
MVTYLFPSLQPHLVRVLAIVTGSYNKKDYRVILEI